MTSLGAQLADDLISGKGNGNEVCAFGVTRIGRLTLKLEGMDHRLGGFFVRLITMMSARSHVL
jgi:hypothetical protein